MIARGTVAGTHVAGKDRLTELERERANLEYLMGAFGKGFKGAGRQI